MAFASPRMSKGQHTMFTDSKALVGTARIQWERYVKSAARKLEWTERVVNVKAFHAAKLREHAAWKVSDTASELNRSQGSISEDLMLAQWSKSYPKILDMTYKDAVAWVRNRKRELDKTE